MTDRVVIPQDAGAPVDAKDELVQFAKLFGSDALDKRLELISAAAARTGGLPIPSGEIGRKVERSLTWGTAAEVALRLLAPPIDADNLARIDAATVVMRIARGLAERRWEQGGLIHSLNAIASDLLSFTSTPPELIQRHYAALAILGQHMDRVAVWSSAEVKMFVESLPIALAMEAACASGGYQPREHWGTRLATLYGACHFLALDLRVLCLVETAADGLVSPTRDAVLVSKTDATMSRNVLVLNVKTCLPMLEAAAEQLHGELVTGREEGQSLLAIDYAQSAVTAAALVFQALGQLGYV